MKTRLISAIRSPALRAVAEAVDRAKGIGDGNGEISLAEVAAAIRAGQVDVPPARLRALERHVARYGVDAGTRPAAARPASTVPTCNVVQARIGALTGVQAGTAGIEPMAVPEQLRVIAPDGRPLTVKFRRLDFDEGGRLLRSDESDDIVENMARYWKKTPTAYYRWDTASDGEVGLINDLARLIFMAAYEDPAYAEALPRAVIIEVDGEERVAGVATHLGDVHFHADSELRRRGYKGIGTALVADYLRECLRNGIAPALTSVNNSYGFYQRLGFLFRDPDHTPASVSDPAHARFEMYVPTAEVAAVLQRLAAR